MELGSETQIQTKPVVLTDEGLQPEEEGVFFFYGQNAAINTLKLTNCLGYSQLAVTVASKEHGQEKDTRETWRRSSTGSMSAVMSGDES